jgi:hypothetical protein
MALDPSAFAKLKGLKPVEPKPESQVVADAVQAAVADEAMVESTLDRLEGIPVPVVTETNQHGLSRLVDENFPFDESQLAAITGMITEQYATLTGAAGTGKTTTTKKLVDELLNASAIVSVDMSTYFPGGDVESDDPDDVYERPARPVPAVCMVSFTGRATQQIKKNFPSDWHGNIMTIHRCLAFKPEWYTDIDHETLEEKKKMRFVPQYTADNKLPWDIIIVDEAGMLGLDLWHQLWAACKTGCRIYMIGDINQLPPVHGRSIFGFAMANWPAFELTHIHRQVGKDNPIVDNAWRVLKGQMPVSSGAFQMVQLEPDAMRAAVQVKRIVPQLRTKGIFIPERDCVIVPINGNEGSRGQALGQIPLNEDFSRIFNKVPISERFIIDGGRERKQFAVGDKVMATKNDYELGITNGMTGIITEITRNAEYRGDKPYLFGSVEEVNDYLRQHAEDNDDAEFELSPEELMAEFESDEEKADKRREEKDRGPSSHIVTVRFGSDEHATEVVFASLAEVASLQMAYAVTCHKMQGGECPTVVIVVHSAHKSMLWREWLYTAITRASQRCIVLYTTDGLRGAINKQRIVGQTLQQKVMAFNQLQKNNGLGATVKFELPASRSRADTGLALTGKSDMADMGDQTETLTPDWQPVQEPIAEPKVFNVTEIHHHTTNIVNVTIKEVTPKINPLDILKKKASIVVSRAEPKASTQEAPVIEPEPKLLALPPATTYDWEPHKGVDFKKLRMDKGLEPDPEIVRLRESLEARRKAQVAKPMNNAAKLSAWLSKKG